jgi:hypothetical protein
MPQTITIHDVDDATAKWLVAEAERRGSVWRRWLGTSYSEASSGSADGQNSRAIMMWIAASAL